jgi:hypothetical protein
MKNIATTPNNSPLLNNIGTIGNKSVVAALSANSGSLPKIAVENQTDVMLEIAIGVSALKEKCRNTASCAKTIPAIGAWNPAAIAAATPHPINTSMPIDLLLKT